MKLNKLYHNDKYWVEYGVYSLALKEKERALNEIYKDLQKAAQAEIAELKELIKREVVPDIKDAEIAKLQSALDVAVEGLEYYSKFTHLSEDVQLKERIGGGKAYQALDKIKKIRATNDAKRHMELSKVLDENGDR